MNRPPIAAYQLTRCAIAVLSLQLCAGLAVADGEDTVGELMGDWATPGFGSTVRLTPCELRQETVELCGTITWLWNALDDKGVPRTDVRNPNRAARGLPLLGARILFGFRRDRDNVWRGGRVYNPDDGRTYSGTIRITDSGLLELKGCALKVFCQTQTWRRAGEVCAAIAAD